MSKQQYFAADIERVCSYKTQDPSLTNRAIARLTGVHFSSVGTILRQHKLNTPIPRKKSDSTVRIKKIPGMITYNCNRCGRPYLHPNEPKRRLWLCSGCNEYALNSYHESYSVCL